MTADERFALIRPKIERAKLHIRDLEIAIQAFRDSNPYPVGTKRDPQTRQLIYYLLSVRETPFTIAAIVGDVIQNLRSALDHLAYQLFLVGPGGIAGNSSKHVYFPIYDSATIYTNATKHKARPGGVVKGLRQDAVNAIDAIEPYKGGNTDKSDTLWRLHTLNIIDKHRLLINVGSSRFGSVNVAPAMQRVIDADPNWPEWAKGVTLPNIFLRPAETLFPLKAGAELFIDLPDAEANEKLDFRFEVAFGEPQICEGQPIVETLQHMADLVDSLVSSFKSLLV
jgi:hypothetical protein